MKKYIALLLAILLLSTLIGCKKRMTYDTNEYGSEYVDLDGWSPVMPIQ